MGRILFAASLLLAAATARAAGGHFEVDDATVLATGHCAAETWLTTERGPAARTQHLGPACRWGASEWGLNLDRSASGGHTTATGAQWKWVADPAARRFSVGAVAAAGREAGSARGWQTSWYVPATVWLGQEGEVQMHFDAGHDHDPQTGGHGRAGAAVDYVLSDPWMLTVERRTLLGHWLSRGGLRYALTPFLSFDASVAGQAGRRVLALGVNWEWER